jgi:RNA polymerase sigma-70 factor (sigma-E family)
MTTDFNEFVESRYQRWVRGGVLAGWPQQDVEDAVQVAVSLAWRRWRRLAAMHNPDAYVMKVVINNLKKDASRRAQRAVSTQPWQTPSDGSDPSEQVARSESVQAALADLPHDQRATVVLRYFLDLSEHDTADVLGVAPGTVKSRTSRALAALSTSTHLREHQEP